jgi:hypothetical protein
MVTLVRLEQVLNAFFPIEFTLLGMVILVMLVQPSNAPSPIVCTPLGMVTLVNREQLLNASFAIEATGRLFTVLGIAKEPTVDVSTSETIISVPALF